MPFNADPHISKTPGFPKDGITFYDISPILEDRVVAKQAMTALAELTHPMKPDIIAGIDARGFLFALPLALELDCGMVMVRKAASCRVNCWNNPMRWNMARPDCPYRHHAS
jgi:adenine phosphoribosyltransferase